MRSLPLRSPPDLDMKFIILSVARTHIFLEPNGQEITLKNYLNIFDIFDDLIFRNTTPLDPKLRAQLFS